MMEPIFELPDNMGLPRVTTGIPKLDMVLGDRGGRLGMPLRSVYEVYGPPGLGKSTLAIYLAAKVDPQGKIVSADLEGAFEQEYVKSVLITAGYAGIFKLLSTFDRLHEDILQELADSLDGGATAIILDSVGMVTPVAEVKGDISDAIIGRRAKVIANLTRRAIGKLTYEDKVFMAVNHQHSIIGGHGFWTPGGDTLKYAASVRLRLKFKESSLPMGGILSEVVVAKLRYGGSRADSQALVVVIPGFGISPLMSVAFEALSDKKATSSSKSKMSDGTIITVGEHKFKAIDLFKAATERDGDTFKPFYEVMGYEMIKETR